MYLNLKAKRLLVRLGCHGIALCLCYLAMLVDQAMKQPLAAGFFALLLLGWLATLRVNPLPRAVEQRLIKAAQCPACAEIIDLENLWSCGCGFQTWETRHAFSLCPNPSCKKVFSWLVCPTCEASIPL